MRSLQAALPAFAAGAASVLAFAPFGLYPVGFLCLGVLAWLLDRASHHRAAFIYGLLWGLGAFLAGVSWIYVALNRYGGMPMPLAGVAVLLFCAYLALFPALAGALFVRLRSGGPVWRAALFAGLWCGSEWLRGVLFTGFPWLASGYSQTPPSPLAGYLPVVGVYGVGGVLAFVSALTAFVPWASRPGMVRALAVVAGVVALGAGGSRVAWTAAEGPPLSVALVQTNIEQSLKWSPEYFTEVLQTNARLVRDSRADFVVLPETTLPTLVERLPVGYLDLLGRYVGERGAALVLGVFTRDADGQIFNSAISVGNGPPQYYAKRHLVPFGEYSPPLFGWFYRLAAIPMSDQTRGAQDQRPMALLGQRIALNICYEDLFGAELLSSLPAASLMLNISNLAWYGDSLAQPQHLQIARVRALETGRPMLRSTNTGMTAVVQPDGSIEAVLPGFEQGVLEAQVRGFTGMTPYARWGNGPVLLLAAVLVSLGGLRRRRDRRLSACA
ncbi:apolipoprotein N-acyltransferase [Azoarcus sp. L1K30]|uniref:apolipoprotein N-acyltransferase n=1 Tax=Azoarcus sp. L1K30 TaxID=2820277 RepID=UPI001B81082A|nr:apolipoprotein N-acyltransferase [Azoarcus sp. L1K30]MBR0568291.1 apolipoprotein N-acyltransferase [Azoarcus sp. L1K30]